MGKKRGREKSEREEEGENKWLKLMLSLYEISPPAIISGSAFHIEDQVMHLVARSQQKTD